MANVSELETLFFRLLEEGSGPLDEDQFREALAGATELTVYLPHPAINSSISAAYMRAFLELQVQINALAAKARGKPTSASLTRSLKLDLEISVVVEDGSSRFKLDLGPVLQKAVGKMTGKQIQATILAVVALAAVGWGVSTWMETQRQVQLEQIKSQEHIHALDALKFATSAEVDSRIRMIDALKSQVELGQDVARLADNAVRELVKATATSGKSAEINGQPVSSDVADLLTLSPRSELTKTQELVHARVIDINTEDLLRPVVEMQEADSGKRFRFRMEDDLFAADQRTALFDALETGDFIQVRVELTKFGDDVRDVKFVTLP